MHENGKECFAKWSEELAGTRNEDVHNRSAARQKEASRNATRSNAGRASRLPGRRRRPTIVPAARWQTARLGRFGNWRRPAGSLLLAGLGHSLARLAAPAQVPPGAVQQLDSAIGQRVEATAVLGTQSTVSRSGLGWKLNDADGSVYKIPWKFELQDPRPVGEGGLTWAPVFEGCAGYAGFENHFKNNALAGNESDFSTVALSLGGGPRFHFGDSGFSALPAFDFLYACTDNDFIARTTAGQAVAADGRFVNWDVHTISFVPSLELRYRKAFGRWTPTCTSGFAYFNTQPISRSTDALSFRSESMAWANKMDVDYLTHWKPFGCPLHFGADFSRTDLQGGLRNAMATDYYYQGEGRIIFDMLDKLWKVDTLGLSGGYFWCGAFSGFSFGLEASLKF